MNGSSPMIRLAHLFAEIGLLFRIRWAEIRTSMLLRFVNLPMFLLSLMMFFRLTGLALDSEIGFYIVTGNVVLSLSVGPISLLMQEMAIKKRSNSIDLFKLLPISLGAYVLALVIAEFLAALPATLASFVLGMACFRCPIAIRLTTLFILPTLFLASFSVAGIGAYIGWRARTPMHANLLGQVVLYVLAFIVPVMIPESRVPALIGGITILSPVHQAARLVRIICLGNPRGDALLLALLLILEGSLFLLLSARAIRARN